MRRPALVAVVVAIQFGLLGFAVHERLSARWFGDEYRLLVEPIDPIDPTRGAYVDLRYAGLGSTGGPDRTLFVPVHAGRSGGFAKLGSPTGERPSQGPFLRCKVRDGAPQCGIESFFASQRTARRIERQLARNRAVARLLIDGAGNAAIVEIEPRP